MALWPADAVALVREEHEGRWELTSAWGEVAHRPSLPEGFPSPGWRAVEGGWASPAHVELRDGELHAPGGWTLAAPADWTATAREAAEDLLPGGVPRAEVLALEPGPGGWAWRMESGLVTLPTGWTGVRAAELHGEMLPVGRLYVNLRRMRGLRWTAGQIRLDDGSVLQVTTGALRTLARRLGLPHLRHLEPDRHRALYDRGLRDWPVELLHMPAEDLERHFGGDRRRLISNAIWQTWRLRRVGRAENYGRDHRGLFYHPLLPVLARAGHLGLEAVEEWTATKDRLFRHYEEILAEMVDRHRLLTFRQLQFEDCRPDLRHVGGQRPLVLVVAEKTSLRREVDALARGFGVSFLQVGGHPSLLAVEYLVEQLPPGPVEVVGFVDWDAQGHEIVESVATHLHRYGRETRPVRLLVRPERFSAREIEELAIPLTADSPGVRERIREWVAWTGGIGGRALGIHADHLRPVDRVLRAFREETGLEEVT